MYLNYIVQKPADARTSASVVPPDRHIDHPMFWAALEAGRDSLTLGARDPRVLAERLRDLANKLELVATDYFAKAAVEKAAEKAAAEAAA